MKKGPPRHRARSRSFFDIDLHDEMLAINHELYSKPISYDEFLNAIRKGEISDVERGLSTLSVNDIIQDENRAFVAACSHHRLDVLNVLLKLKEVEALAASEDNMALRMASALGYRDVVKRLLEIKEVIHSAQNNQNIALRMAAKHGWLDIVNKLLKIDAVIEAITDGDELHWSAQNGHLDIVNRLLEIRSVKFNAASHENFAFSKALENNHFAIAIRLFKVPFVQAHVEKYKPELLLKDSVFSIVRQQYAKSKTTAFLSLKQTPLPLFLRKKILQEVFHDTECGNSSCFKAEPSSITSTISLCPLFKGAVKPVRPLVELLDAREPLAKKSRM